LGWRLRQGFRIWSKERKDVRRERHFQLPGRWRRDSPDGYSELTLVTSAGVVRGDLFWVALGGRPARFKSYVIERGGTGLVLQLTLPEQEGPTPY